MKVLVVFGSTSDENVAGPLVKDLKAGFDVDYAVISAHRDLEKLQQKIHDWEGDAIIAGAGLAAALPGVVAAMTRIPVFGVPVPSQFGGLDSFASIAQMPPGVPVLTCGPGKTGEIVSFLENYRAAAGEPFTRIHFVAAADHPEIAGLVDKAKPAAEDAGLAVSRGNGPVKDGFNVFMVSKPEQVSKDFGLHLPFFPQSEVSAPAGYLAALAFAEQGGLWVGANNTRNAVHAAIRLGGAAKLLQERAA